MSSRRFHNGYEYGGCGRYGYGGYCGGYGFPYLSVPIINSNYRINGLLNEYAELNDLSIRNNDLYYQSVLQNQRPMNVYNTYIQRPAAYYGVNSYTNPYLFY
jgi:hypothetical protein